VNPGAGLDDAKRKFLTLPGLELRPCSRPARRQSLYRLSYPGSCIKKDKGENEDWPFERPRHQVPMQGKLVNARRTEWKNHSSRTTPRHIVRIARDRLTQREHKIGVIHTLDAFINSGYTRIASNEWTKLSSEYE
jgi:hypothetical protein